MSLIYPKSIFICLPDGRMINTRDIRAIVPLKLINNDEKVKGEYALFWSFTSSPFLPLTEEEYQLIRGEFLNLSVTTEVNDG